MRSAGLGRPPPPRLEPAERPALLSALRALDEASPESFEAVFGDGAAARFPAAQTRSLGVVRRARLVRGASGLGRLLDPRRVRATVRLYVIDGRLIATDRPERDARDQVFPLMLEQAAMIASLDVDSNMRVFEPCVGSGVLSIAAASRGASVVATDISPRALAFARFNATLAGVEGRLDLRLGSLATPLRDDERFDLVIANPPFEPLPDGAYLPWHSAGGADGLDVVRALMPAIAPRLTERGRVALVTWVLGGDDPWGDLGPLLATTWPASRRDVAVLADDPLAPHAERFASARGYAAWRRLLADRGLERIRLVLVRIDLAGPPGAASIEPAPLLTEARRVLPRLLVR